MNRLGSVNFENFLATAMNIPIIFETPPPSSSPGVSSSSTSSSSTVIIVSTVVVVGSILLAAVVAVVMYKRGCVRWHGAANNSSYSDVARSTAAPPWNTSVALENGPVDSDASRDRAISSDRQMGISLTVFEAIPPAPPQAEDADIPDDPNLNLNMEEDQYDAERDSGGLHYAPSAVVTWKEFNGNMV